MTIGAILAAASILAALAQQGRGGPPMPGLTLTTPAFEDGGIIPNKYSQADPNPVSPKLEWSTFPPAP